MLGKREGDHYVGGYGFQFTPRSNAEVKFRVHVEDADKAFRYLAKCAQALGGYTLADDGGAGQTSGDDWESILGTIASVANRPEAKAAAAVIPYGELIRGVAAGAPDAIRMVQGIAGGKASPPKMVQTVARAAQGDPDAVAYYAEVTRRDGTSATASRLAAQAKFAAINLTMLQIRAEEARLAELKAKLREQMGPIAKRIVDGRRQAPQRSGATQYDVTRSTNAEGYGA